MARSTLLFLCVVLTVTGPIAAQTLPAEARFVMSHFKANAGGGDERLFVSWSPDGLNWTCLNNGLPVWQPPGWEGFWNVVRDPSIIFANGYYWVAYTAGNYGKGAKFGLVKSTDLVNWEFVASVDVTLPGATDQLTWNPVFFEDGDGSIHATIAISPVGGSQYNCVPYMRVHEIHPVSPDWSTWSTPVPLDLPDPNTNEGWLWKEGDTYHICYVSFTRFGQVVHATSNNLVGGWTFDKGLGYGGQEGGMILPKPGGGYRLYLEPGNADASADESTLGYRTCDLDDTLSNPTPQVRVNATVPMRNGKMCAARRTMTFEQWQAAHLSNTSTERRGPLDDADDDGLANLIEHSLGTDPLTHTTESFRPRPYQHFGNNGNYPGLIYENSRSSANVSGFGELKIGNGPWNQSPPGAFLESVALLSNGTVRCYLRSGIPLGSEPVLYRYSASLNPAFSPLSPAPSKATKTIERRKIRKMRR